MSRISKVQCLIVDDEPLAAEVLKSHIGKLGSFEIAGIAGDAFEAFDMLNKRQVDLMFLDIHMPQMKGTELLKTLKNQPPTILTTAYREYALEGFDLNVLDYLLKPVSYPRFMQAVEKFFLLYQSDREITLQEKGTGSEYIYIKEKNLVHKIPLDEIVYVESMGDNLTVHTLGRTITNRSTISSVEKLLDGRGFIRIHRSFIISLSHITSFSPTSLNLEGKEFPVGASYKSRVYAKLNFDGFGSKS